MTAKSVSLAICIINSEWGSGRVGVEDLLDGRVNSPPQQSALSTPNCGTLSNVFLKKIITPAPASESCDSEAGAGVMKGVRKITR